MSGSWTYIVEPAHTEVIDAALQSMDGGHTEDMSVFILDGGSVQLSFNPLPSSASSDEIEETRGDIEAQLNAAGLKWQLAH